MRTVLIVFLVSAILTGCQNAKTNSVTPVSKRSPIPRAVLQLADAYIDSLPNQQGQNREAIREDFSQNFFEGFVMPGAPIGDLTEGGEQGLRAGRKYRLLTNPTTIKEIMEGYGYVATKADGIWVGRHFEDICFRPNTHPTQRWGLRYLGDAKAHANALVLLDITEMPIEGVRIHIEGYLSPRVIFPAPIGGRDYEFFATSISNIDGG